MNALRRCFLLFTVLISHMPLQNGASQSFITVEQAGTDFFPANPIELIATYNGASTLMACCNRCHLNVKCRTFVSDTTWPFVCRLYEGSIDTGTIIVSSSSTSQVGSYHYNPPAYVDYNQSCDSDLSAFNRFLICINGIWHCPIDTYWNGSMCLNDIYYDHSCNTNEVCREDVGLFCHPLYNKCMCNSTSTWNNASCENCSGVWQQCGGLSYTGPICCIDSTCTYINNSYSQCTPISGAYTSSLSYPSNTFSSITVLSDNSSHQNGVTSRYWDCCKVSCGWGGKASVTNPVETCALDGMTSVDRNTQSGCNSGTAFTCNNQQPWSFNDTLAYGYAGASIIGQSESDWCCACYSLIFTSGPIVGKEMIVQATNTLYDLNNNHFNLQIPGGGMGSLSGCLSQYSNNYSWGQQNGGVSQRSDCANLPSAIQAGCYWRFDWFMDAGNPTINFQEVSCPNVLTANTLCSRI